MDSDNLVPALIRAIPPVLNMISQMNTKSNSVPGNSDPFLDYDIAKLIGIYAEENAAQVGVPYVLEHDFLQGPHRGQSILPIKLLLAGEQLQLSPGSATWQSVSEVGAAAFREGRVSHDEPLIRVDAFRIDSGTLVLDVHRAFYSDQVRSNLILDFVRPGDAQRLTLRSLLQLERGGKLPLLSDRRMANTLGLALLLFYRHRGEWVPYLVRRTQKVGVFPGKLHCSASGAAKWRQAAPTYSDLSGHLLEEAKEELGLEPSDLRAFEPVAFCREMLRGGKPQLFYCAYTDLDRGQLREKRKAAARVVKTSNLWPEIEPDTLLKNADEVMPLDQVAQKADLVTLEALAACEFGKRYLQMLQSGPRV